MDYQDKTLTCKECNSEFVWTGGEQAFYASKNLSSPSRCKDCRAKRRNEGRRDELHDIICSSCGKPGQVPFKPKSDDVLCRECYMQSKQG